jgi:hypothetical protein
VEGSGTKLAFASGNEDATMKRCQNGRCPGGYSNPAHLEYEVSMLRARSWFCWKGEE